MHLELVEDLAGAENEEDGGNKFDWGSGGFFSGFCRLWTEFAPTEAHWVHLRQEGMREGQGRLQVLHEDERAEESEFELCGRGIVGEEGVDDRAFAIRARQSILR